LVLLFGLVCYCIVDPFDEYHDSLDLASLLPDGSRALDAVKAKHAIVHSDLRPSLPPPEEQCPEAFASLITRCWHADAKQRPTFDTIVAEILALLRITVDSDHGQRLPTLHYNHLMVTPRTHRPLSQDRIARLSTILCEVYTYTLPMSVFGSSLNITHSRAWIGCCNGDIVSLNASVCGVQSVVEYNTLL
jgi:hypothetical protein